MAKYRGAKESEEDDVVDTLLKLPAKNLESRLRQLESDVRQRHDLRNHALSTLGTHKLQLKDQSFRLRYASLSNTGFQTSQDCLREIIRLDQSIISEMISCFQDVLRLKENIQEAQEELELEKQKLLLIESEQEDTETNEFSHRKKTK